jgi:23S rRNA pseudouridine2605 synthase
MQRVQKLLSNYGYCSRRKAEELIIAGKVKVNDKLITIGDKATLDDKIYVEDKLVSSVKKVYLKFNKPTKCVSALSDKNHKTVIDYIKVGTRIFPIGRLDFNTSGLLLLTNDGDFANKIMHPRYEIKKTYRVISVELITKESIQKIEQGIMLDDFKTLPAKVKVVNDNTIDITIHEGKNRIIRRIMKKLGYSIKTLQRISIGKLRLDSLKEKEYKELNELEKKQIFE